MDKIRNMHNVALGIIIGLFWGEFFKHALSLNGIWE